MAEITTRTMKASEVQYSPDGTLEVLIEKVTTKRDGRGHRGSTFEDYAKFELTVEEAAALMRELAEALASGYRKHATGVPEEDW